ncbi:MAG TPA: efflux RND transporter periplasmic adaptor subunit, partial [Chthoniobacteraceae bacterium]
MTQPVLSEPPHPPGESHSTAAPKSSKPARRFGLRSLVVWAVALAVVFAILRYAFHSGSSESSAIPTVAVAKADREDLAEDLWLTAEFVPFLEVSLHAKVAGYLKSISVDVGDEVKAGQKIAELEIPELEDDVVRSESAYQESLQDVKKAEADSAQAEITYQRLLGVSKDHPKLVAQQDLDEAKAKDEAMKGALGAARQQVESRQSDIKRTTTLRDYSFITVPFGGIVTRRYADPGALIQAGISSNTQAMPLVDLAEQDKLRLVFPVPESVTPLVHLDAPVEVTVSALNQTFQGKISRFAGKVD